ncbi:MAG: hypothetical protein WB919_07380 [Candidatus Sulfotelmatobacter sp.]
MDDPPFGEAPGFEGEPPVVGLLLGLVLGFGFIVDGLFGLVEGCVPAVLGLVGFDPGVAEPVGGAVVLPVGGWAALPVGG